MAGILGRRLAISAALFGLGAVAAPATPRVQRAFITQYPNVAGSKLAQCVVCHLATPPHLNPYGEEFLAGQGGGEILAAQRGWLVKKDAAQGSSPTVRGRPTARD